MISSPLNEERTRAVGDLLHVQGRVRMEQRDFDLALLDAAQAGDASSIQSLIGQGARAKSEIGDCALFIATDSGYAEVAKILLAHGARPNARDPKDSMPLHHAALLGHNHLVRLLLDNGARIDGKNRDNETALHAATIAGHTDTVDLLLSRSAKTDAKDDLGLTPSCTRPTMVAPPSWNCC